jgi:hypothetical protein
MHLPDTQSNPNHLLLSEKHSKVLASRPDTKLAHSQKSAKMIAAKQRCLKSCNDENGEGQTGDCFKAGNTPSSLSVQQEVSAVLSEIDPSDWQKTPKVLQKC